MFNFSLRSVPGRILAVARSLEAIGVQGESREQRHQRRLERGEKAHYSFKGHFNYNCMPNTHDTDKSLEIEHKRSEMATALFPLLAQAM